MEEVPFTPKPGRLSYSKCPKCEVCYDIPAEFSKHITPIINDILTTKLALDPIDPMMRGGSKRSYWRRLEYDPEELVTARNHALMHDPAKLGLHCYGRERKDELVGGLSTKPIPGRKKVQPSHYQEKFGTYLNDIVLPALEKIQSALLCPEPNNSGEIENINSNYYGGSSMKKRKKTLKVMRGGMKCKSCTACVYRNTHPQVIKDALNKCIKIINTIILTNGNQITYIGDTDSNKSIRDKITIDMTNAMKVIQEKSPCPVANNSGESENSYWGGGKRSTRKLAMKKRRKSLRRRRF